MPLADQLTQVLSLKKAGKTSFEIAAATGLEVGDVESVLSGALPAGVGPTPEALVAQTFSLLPEWPMPGTHQNVFADRPDAVDFLTVPALTLFLVNFDVEVSGAPDPANAALPLGIALQVVARPASGVWLPALGISAGSDAPIVQSNNPILQQVPGGGAPDTYYEVIGETTVYVVQYPQDVKLTLQYMAENAGNTLTAGSKLRNLKVTTVTMNPSLAG